MPHERMLATRRTYTWINKYIFPGGFLPSVEAIERDHAREQTGLRVIDRLSFGSHYAETLRQWDERFAAARDEVLGLGFDETFVRMWHFYLEYSRAGFASGLHRRQPDRAGARGGPMTATLTRRTTTPRRGGVAAELAEAAAAAGR